MMMSLRPEAAEVEQGGGEGEHHGSDEGAAASDVVAQEPGQSYEGGAEQGVAEAGGEVAIAQDGEDGGYHFYLKGAVHPGGMEVVGAENPGPA